MRGRGRNGGQVKIPVDVTAENVGVEGVKRNLEMAIILVRTGCVENKVDIPDGFGF